jgi:hypothetical protein
LTFGNIPLTVTRLFWAVPKRFPQQKTAIENNQKGLVTTLAEVMNILSGKLDPENLAKLTALNNGKLNAFVAEAIELTNPDSVFVATDADGRKTAAANTR